MKGLAIDNLCHEFRIRDPYDGWLFRIMAIRIAGPFVLDWQIQVNHPQTTDWLGLDEEKNVFDDFEEAYDCLDNYMQGRWRSAGRFD